ncbi:hypothetical protein T492DRAFT_848990 [Pavlovales sp. CCMP2436]|nr:hypothetical protein T492DRAFT_848990 [Pavlovales sp. CCMP2436]
MADARHEETQEEENHEVLRILVVALLGLIIGTFVRFTETQLLPIVRDAFRCASLALPPYSLSVFLAGVITSGLRDALSERLHETGATNEIFSEAIADAQLVEPSVILLVLLPPLIYMSAVHMSWVVFRRVSGQALLLAFPGVILQAYIVAAFFRTRYLPV